MSNPTGDALVAAGWNGDMSRTFYGWEKDGKFYLSAFARARTYDGKRPAMEFDERALLDSEVSTRRGELVWEDAHK